MRHYFFTLLWIAIWISNIVPLVGSSVVSRKYVWKHNWNIHFTTSENTRGNINDAPPLLLVPGFGAGQGKSWPENGVTKEGSQLVYSVDTWKEQLIHFVEEVIGEPAHIAGNSLGGYLSAYAAACRPDLIKTLTLVNPTPFWGFAPPAIDDSDVPSSQHKTSVDDSDIFQLFKYPVIPRLWDGVLPAPSYLLRFGGFYFDNLRSPNVVRRMLQAVYSSGSVLNDEVLVNNIIESASQPGGHEAFTSILFAPKARMSFDDMLRQVSCPISLIMGRDDPWITPFWGQRIKRIRPDVVYYELSDSGHCPHHESPNAFNEIISNVLWKAEGNKSISANEECFEVEERCGRTVKVQLRDGTPESLVEKIGDFFHRKELSTNAINR